MAPSIARLTNLIGTADGTGYNCVWGGGEIGIHIIKRDSSSITVTGQAERGPFVIIVRAASCRHRIVNMRHAVCCPLVGELHVVVVVVVDGVEQNQ